jgi:surface-anchored protein
MGFALLAANLSSILYATLLPLLLACGGPLPTPPGSVGSAGEPSTTDVTLPVAGAGGAAGDPGAVRAVGGAGAAEGGATGIEVPLAGAPTGGAGSDDCELTYGEGHGDLFVRFDRGLDLSVRSTFGSASPEILAETSRVCVLVPAASRALAESMGGAPESADYAFLGVSAGDPFWLLPATPRAGMPWFGASTEDVPAGRYDGNEVRVAIASIEMPTSGQFAAWSTSSFGVPSAMFSTATGMLTHFFPIGAHVHFNWAFSVSGTYVITFIVEGTHDGTSDLTPLSPLRFLVGR